MQTRYPVKALCQAYFTASEAGASSLDQFFRSTLGLADCSWSHLLDEVKYLKATSCTDFDRISDLYTLIDQSIGRTNVDDIERLRLDYSFLQAKGAGLWLTNNIPGKPLTTMP